MTPPLDSRDEHLLRHPEDPRVRDDGEGHSDGNTEEHQAAQLEIDIMLCAKSLALVGHETVVARNAYLFDEYDWVLFEEETGDGFAWEVSGCSS